MQVVAKNVSVGKSNHRKVPTMLIKGGQAYEVSEGTKPGTYQIASGELQGRVYRKDRFQKQE